MSEKQTNRIGQDFTIWQLVWFAMPALLNNLFTQLFRTLDDGLFVSRFVGETALAGINILHPCQMVHVALSHLFAIGSATISARLMGQGKQDEAKRVFTRVTIGCFITGLLYSIVMNLFPNTILNLLGADEAISQYSIVSIKSVYIIESISLTSCVFNSYFSTAGKPSMGLVCSIVNGTINIVLDVVLVAVMKLGVLGACISTVTGEVVVFIIGLIFFIRKKNEIHFVKPQGDFIPTILKSFKSGLPQCINSLSIALLSLLTNRLIMKNLGSEGVAASAIISDLRRVLTTSFVGFVTCVGPVISYNFGSRNVERLRKILFYTAKIWFFGSLMVTGLGYLIRKPLISIFLSESSTQSFYDIAYTGLSIDFISIPFMAGCVMLSRVFVSLGNTKASTALAIMRVLVFRMLMLYTLPFLIKDIGIWLIYPAAEMLSLSFGGVLLYINRNNYGYGKNKIAELMN